LQCSKGNWGDGNRDFPNFFSRIAYHLFFSSNKKILEKKTVRSKLDVFKGQNLVSELYRRSFSVMRKGDTIVRTDLPPPAEETGRHEMSGPPAFRPAPPALADEVEPLGGQVV